MNVLMLIVIENLKKLKKKKKKKSTCTVVTTTLLCSDTLNKQALYYSIISQPRRMEWDPPYGFQI
jgi:hypothetical protein